MTASLRSLRSFLASICTPSALRLGSVASLSLVIGVVCVLSAGAQTASYGGAYEVLGGQLTYPTGVAVDSSGNVYLAMPALSAVEEIPASCIAGVNNNTCVITLGGGFSDPTGVAVDASGNVYVADTDKDAIKEIPASCIAGDNNAGCVIQLGGGFREPYGVAVDGSGDVFVADTFKSKVMEIPASCISGANDAACVKELGAGYVASPIGIAVDASGNVYVGDTGNGTVDEIPYSCIHGANNSTCVITLGGGFDSPYGVSVDGSGNVFVADVGESKVSEIPSGCTVSSCVVPVGGGFDDPYGVAVGTGESVYIADSSNWEVKRLWLQGVDFGTVPVAAGTPASRTLIFTFVTGGTIGAPVVVTGGAASLDFTDAGTGSCTTQGTSHVYEANDVCTVDVNLTPQHPGERNGAVLLENNSGQVLAIGYIHGIGAGPQITFADSTAGYYAPSSVTAMGGGLNSPLDVAVDGSGNVYVADNGHNSVKEIPSSCFSGGCVSTLGGGFSNDMGVAVDGAGNVYVADTGHSAVKEIPLGCTNSGCVATLGGGFSAPEGVTVDGSGNVYVADATSGAVKEIPVGCLTSSCVTTVATGFNHPRGVALDGSGNVYVANSSASQVTEIAPGCSTASCGTTLGGGFNTPSSVAVDAGGNVFVADLDNSAVKWIPAGCTSSACVVTTGSGFTAPYGIALNGSGNLYVIDQSGSAAALLDFIDPPSLNFATTSIGFTSSDSPQTVTAINDGNQPLNFSGLSAPADFPLDSTGGSVCSSSTTLAADAYCTLPIDFTPENTGSLSENLTLTDNNLNAPSVNQSISVNATGNPAPDTTTTYVSISASSLNSGQTTTVTATVNDTGVRATTPTGTVIFSWSCSGICEYDTSSTSNSASGFLNGGNPVGLVGGVATLAGVSFSTAGSYTITANYSGVSETFLSSSNSAQSDGNNQTTVSWSAATATAPAAASLGSVNLGSSTRQSVTFTIQTTGTIGTPVVVTQGATGKDFTDAGDGTCDSNNGVSYGYNSSDTCTVEVQFAPQYPGPRYGAVLLEDNSGNILATAYIYGTGSGPQASFLPGAQSTVTTSTLSSPSGVVSDLSGNLYIADSGNSRVLKETLSGGSYTESTVGSGWSTPNSVAVDGAGNLYISDAGLNEVAMLPWTGSGYGAAVPVIGAGQVVTAGIAVDRSGNVYVADSQNGQILMESPQGGSYSQSSIITGLNQLNGVAVDGSGNLYLIDLDGSNQPQVVLETFSEGSYTPSQVAGNLTSPSGLAVDLNGNVYITEGGTTTVLRETLSGASYSSSTIATVTNPAAVAMDQLGNLYITSTSTNLLYKQDFADAPTLSFATTAEGVASSDSPQTVTVDNEGNASLVFSGLSTPTDFPLDSTGGSVCSSSTMLAANTACTLPIDFKPLTINTFSESVTLTDNSLNVPLTTQTIPVSGTGIAPTITLSPASGSPTTLTAGTVAVAYSMSFTASGGASPYGYAETAGTLPQGLSLSSSGTLSGTPTNANSGTPYSFTVTATDADGFTGNQSYSLTIGPGTATINITPYSVTYDGNPHTASGTATGANSLDLSSGLTLSGTTHTNAGSYPNDAWSFHDAAGNYNDASGTVNDTISQATATISITPYSVTYDANAHTATGTATGVGAVDLSAGLTLTATTHTNAGSYTTDPWSFHDVTGNYADAGGTVSDLISQAAATINVLGYSVNYDGNPHSASGTASGVGSVNLNADLNLNGTAHTSVGSYTDPWSFTDPTGNYAFASGTVSDSIAQVTATATAPAPYNFGSTSIGSPSTYLVTFTFQTVGSIGTPVVVTEGATGLDFTDLLDGTCNTNGTSYDYSVSATCTVDVQFLPQHPGPRYGAVLLEDSSGNILATAYVYGVGAGPQATFATNSSGVYAPKSTATLGGGFNAPYLTAVDGSGNVYVADYNNNAVEEIPSGCSTSSCVLILGGGFNNPIGVAVDGAGNVFVGDAGHAMVKMIPSGCTSSTCVASLGSGFSRPSGVAVDGSGNVFVADSSNSSVSEILAAGGYTTVNALGSGFTAPSGIAVDESGNVFVTDQSTNLVSEITASSGYATVNTLGSGFLAPFGVAVDAAGNVYVADTGNAKVKEMLAVSGSIPATPTINLLGSGFSSPIGMALDGSGNVYVSDGNAVEELDYADPPSLSFATTVAGSTSADSPQTVTVTDDGNASLAFSGLSAPADFQLNSTGGSVCSSTTTLAASAFCTLPIDFMPTTNTLLNESLTLTDNSLNASSATQSISLSGTGTTPTITFTAPANTTLPAGAVGVPYSGANFQATGGAIPYTYSGAVPAGMTLSAGGVLSGTPAAAETSYNLTVTATDKNGFTGSQSYSLTIGPGTATIDITPYDVTYDGNAHTATATATGVDGAALSSSDFNLTGTTHTNAGSYSDSWSFHDPSGTYADASGTITDTIARATATIDTNSYNVIYDGNAHTATGTATGVGGANLNSDLNLTGTTHTNAGNYTADAWSFHDASGNYNDASGTMIDTIAKASATINVTPYDMTYDGSAHTATATARGIGGAALSSGDFTLTGTTHTNAGSYATDAWSFHDSSGNYADASGTVSDTIARASATINVTPYDVTYDGNAHTATGTATGVGGAALSSSDFTLTGTTHTSAGSYPTDAWSFSDPSGNYLSASGTVSDTIAKASATVNVTPYDVTYDGNAHTATGTATGVGGAALSGSDINLTGTTHTNAGSYPSDAWSFTDPSGNYLSASGTVSDTIAKASATINVTPYDVTYDGNAHTATGTATGVGGAALSGSDFTLTGTTHTNVGSYPSDAWSFTDPSGNYASASGTVSDTINDATATVTLGSLAQTYTGSPISVTASTNPPGLTVSFMYTGKDSTTYGPSSTPPTAAGSYTVVGTINDETDYIGSNSGTLVIAKASSQVASLLSNSNPAMPGSPVTFTATVTSTAGTPTGTVSFVDNSGTTLGQGTLSSGMATLTTDFTNAQDGSNSITAVYSGDTNFLGSSSGILTETVMAFSLSTGSGGVTTQTVSSGGTATYDLSITPTTGTTFPTAVTLTVSGMPPGATATISPSTWTQLTSTSWSLPANTALTAITLSIQLPATSSRLDPQGTTGRKLPPVLWGVLLLPFAGRLRRAGRRMRRAVSLMLLLAASLAVVTALGGCGGGSSSNSSQASDYSITVTATAGAVSNSTTLTLIVN